MAENSKIEWTHHTFNPWVGCTKVSPACDHCYAEGWAKRTGGAALWQGERRRTSAANWREPIKWNKRAEADDQRYRVFCASLADVFDNQIPGEWRDDLFALIRATPNLDWLLLTKRPQNIRKMLPAGWSAGPWKNVWLGTSTENREEMLRRGRALKAVPAAVHFWSAEPLLEDLGTIPAGIMPSWVIAGGESGANARPMHPDWARSLRDQCAAAGVPFLFKQWGEWAPPEAFGATQWGPVTDWHGKIRNPARFYVEVGEERADRLDAHSFDRHWTNPVFCLGKKRAGRLLDGVEHNGYPAVGGSNA